MTIRAYQETYLSKARAALGDAFDYAVNDCKVPGADFTKLFTVSSVSRRLENGEPAYLAGKSGIEIAVDILLETTGKQPDAKPQEHLGAPGNTGLAGPSAIISGFLREASATFLRFSLTRI